MNKEEKLEIIRHSLSHIMAAAVLDIRQDTKFAIGPAIDNGFYYDFDLGEKTINEEDLKKIEKRMKYLVKRNIKFERFVLSVNKALAREKKNNQIYKVELIKDLKKEGETEVSYFRLGDFEDLCRGPHLESTGKIKKGSFKLDKIAGAYWRGDEKNKMLTRIYGLGFGDKKSLDEYIVMMKEAEKRNHRKIGAEMGLFTIFNEVGQGLPIWLPNGYAMRRVLEDYMLKMERIYGYNHILTPIINKKELFEKSGHLGFYDKDMYAPLEIDNEVFYLKPMNCPAGMMIYKMKPKSYRELPIKMGEFGTVYRYEKSGELQGLQRVRGFTQNDAHIFCTPGQLEDQFMEVFEILEKFYRDVGFDNYKYRLSLGDDDNTKYVGDRKDWIKAEETMRRVLRKNKVDFYEVKGEAAFYGPKLDVQAINVFGKEDSISTIQVDFNLPDRFDLTYIDKNGKKKRPFVIHRALIGSFERFFAFLIEYYAGNFPVWFAPVQVKLVAVSEKHNDHLKKLNKEFLEKDIRVEMDISDETVGNKIRKAVKEKVPYMLVIGDKEIKSDKFHVRDRGSDKIREISQTDFYKEIEDKNKNKK
ncbi:threonine--tRNA ligase [bacterium]|nr:threonine--tRNA ligase [bacterium]